MARTYAHVLGFALGTPWAIEPSMMPVIAEILARHIAGADSDAEIEAALVNRKNLPQPRAGSVAVIPLYGVIAPRMSAMTEMSGGTTFEKLTAQLREAVADKSVKTIVFDVNSPGGSVAGATEFARELARARTKKPIIAQAQYQMASAAYWAMAGATEIIAAPSAMVGSLGIVTSHNDISAALEKNGIKRKTISAGKGKTYGVDSEALSAEAETRMRALVDAAYAQMVTDVVKGRGAGMTASRVKDDWQALIYTAAEAEVNGMTDGTATLDETIQRVLSTSPDAADQRAAREFTSPIVATLPSVAARDAQLERQLLAMQLL